MELQDIIIWDILNYEELKDKNVGSPSGPFRVYGDQGKEYPRLVFSIYDDPITGLQLHASFKQDPMSFWEETGVPTDLVLEAAKFLKENKLIMSDCSKVS